MNIQNNSLNPNNVAFSGHKKTTDKCGYEEQNFFYLFDPTKYNCEVELYNIKKDTKGNYSIDGETPAALLPMRANNVSVKLSDFSNLYTDEGFAYRYKLTDKNNKKVSYAFDNGCVIGMYDNSPQVEESKFSEKNIVQSDNKYNLILSNRAIINKNGPMQLIMPDGYYPGIIGKNKKPKLDKEQRKEALDTVRTHANKLGGNFYGIIEKLPDIENMEGIARIVGTPFTKDTISSHKYWTENSYQISPDFGTEEDFRVLQEELMKHGINWIADAALVNEGFKGIHMSEFLRKGQDSVSKDMFRAAERPSLGIIPDNSKTTRIKFINAPFDIKSKSNKDVLVKNSSYDYKKPTYIQFYDENLASEAQKKSEKIFDTYDIKNTDNIYEITKYDDVVHPYALEVNPEELSRNVAKIVKNKKLDLSDVNTIKKITDFSTFNVVTKGENAGLEVWDGNIDIPKLKFFRCNSDDARIKKLPQEEIAEAEDDFNRGYLAVQDYAINSGKYWTKLTDDIQFDYVSKLFENVKNKDAQGYMEAIEKAVDEGKLPKLTLKNHNVDKEVVQNVLNDNYHLKRLDDADMRSLVNSEDYGNEYLLTDYIIKQSMDLPLETLPFSSNVLGILTGPYIAKKANTENELGVSRYDLMMSGNPNLPDKYAKVYEQVEKIYTDAIVSIVSEVIPNINDYKDGDNVSEYGKYVISQIAPEITKFVFVKALNPKAEITYTDDGRLDFSKVDPEDTTIQSLGIPFNSKTSEEEAQMLVNKIIEGIGEIKTSDIEELKKNTKKRFENRSLTDFKMAEMIMDKTESGLGWRIDAAKDVASIDSIRADVDNNSASWKQVIDFWKKYNQGVLEYNPHAYTTAEITDLSTIFSLDPDNEFICDADAERKFLEQTGITSVANYNYFFTMPPTLFANYDPDGDSTSWKAMESKNLEIGQKLDTGWEGNPGFLFQSPQDGVTNSYTFVGNHDKPRIIELFALDMYMYNTIPLTEAEIERAKEIGDYNSLKSIERDEMFKKETAKFLGKKSIESINFDKIEPKSITMGIRLNQAIDEVVPEVENPKLNKQLKNSVLNLAQGRYKGQAINPEAFGTRDFATAIKTVLDDAESIDKVEYKSSYTNKENKKININNKEDLEAELLKSILVPAFDRLQSVTKLLTLLPGSPTDFAGDKLGVSGYETKAKNEFQQNRNVIPWEHLSNPRYKFVLDNYNKMNEISNLRNRQELSALNDGTTITLPLDNDGDYIQAFIRYNEDSTVLVIGDSAGSKNKVNERMDRSKKDYKAIQKLPLKINDKNVRQGLKHGIKVGTKFKNARKSDLSEYIVRQDKNGEYYLQRIQMDAKNKPSEMPIKIEEEDNNYLVLYEVK